MGAVVARFDGRSKMGAGLIAAEGLAVDIIDIAVAVIIHTRLTVELGLIDPEVLLQVFVLEIAAGVAHCDNDIRASGGYLPGLQDIQIAAEEFLSTCADTFLAIVV